MRCAPSARWSGWPRSAACCCRRRRRQVSLTVTDADVRMRLAPDAALLVSEQLEIEFDGQLAGRVPGHPAGRRTSGSPTSRSGEGNRRYQLGRMHSLGCISRQVGFGATQTPAGDGFRTSGTTRRATRPARSPSTIGSGGTRSSRTPTCSTGMAGLGRQWDLISPSLAQGREPARLGPAEPANPLYRGSGASPATSRAADISRDPGIARLGGLRTSRDGQFVEMRVTIPRTPGPGRRGRPAGRGRGPAGGDPGRGAGGTTTTTTRSSTGPSAGSPTTQCCWR